MQEGRLGCGGYRCEERKAEGWLQSGQTCRVKAQVQVHEGVTGGRGQGFLLPLMRQHVLWYELHSVPDGGVADYCLPCMPTPSPPCSAAAFLARTPRHHSDTMQHASSRKLISVATQGFCIRSDQEASTQLLGQTAAYERPRPQSMLILGGLSVMHQPHVAFWCNRTMQVQITSHPRPVSTGELGSVYNQLGNSLDFHGDEYCSL